MNEKEHFKLKEILAVPVKAAVLMHRSPDGDAVGSALAMYHFLNKLGHNTTVITPDAFPDFLKWLPGSKSIINFKKTPSLALQAIHGAKLIVCVDFNALKRIAGLGEEVGKSKAFKLLIDHHPQPDDFADITFHNVHASSTSELIYDLLVQLGEKKKINKIIANCLYTGVMTDTGSFRFPSTTVHTHEVAAELIRHGAENAKVQKLVEDANREITLRLFGFTLLEKMKILPEFSTGFIALSKNDLERFDYREGDTEGFVNMPISVKGISFSALFTQLPKEKEIKISFRSRNNFDVNLFARKHFNGGGHKNAAGGKSDLTLDETIMKFLQLLSVYKQELNQ